METGAPCSDLVVREAEAMVHAEWLRLQLDERARYADDMPAEEVILHEPAQAEDAGTASAGRTGDPPEPDASRVVPTYPPSHVRASQRSPPHRSDSSSKDVVGQRR